MDERQLDLSSFYKPKQAIRKNTMDQFCIIPLGETREKKRQLPIRKETVCLGRLLQTVYS